MKPVVNNHTIWPWLALLLAALTLRCGHKETKEDLLFRVGVTGVPVLEFRQRAEFTVLPRFARDKRMLLNNLVAEKLLAEAAKRNFGTAAQVSQSAMLLGIKQQKMRELLYRQVGRQQGKLDTLQLMASYRASQREYQVAWQVLSSRREVAEVRKMAVDRAAVTAAFDRLGHIRAAGERTLHWNDPSLGVLFRELYSQPRARGEVIGPVEIEEGVCLLLQIRDWQDVALIGPEEQHLRLDQVTRKMEQVRNERAWRDYLREVMSGARIEFQPAAFDRLFRIYASQLKGTEGGHLSAGSGGGGQSPAELQRLLAQEPDAPFFTIHDQTWTIADFKKALASHPLVFDTDNPWATPAEIRFRNAIAGVVRDQRLDRIAQDAGLAEAPEVKETTAMWVDALLALQQRTQVLQSAIDRGDLDKNDNSAKVAFLDRYIAGLPHELNLAVAVDYRRLNEIELMPGDMMVLQTRVPWPRVVPGFPQYTSNVTLRWPDHRLDQEQ